MLSRVELASDRRRATLFLLEPLPGSTRVCLGVVAFLGLFDWITDNYPFGDPADTVIGMLAEVNEMVLAFAGLLFAITLAWRFRAGARTGESLKGSSPRPV